MEVANGQIDHSQALPDHEVKVCVDLDGDPCLASLCYAEAEKNLTSVFSSYGNAQEKFHLPLYPSQSSSSPLLRAPRDDESIEFSLQILMIDFVKLLLLLEVKIYVVKRTTIRVHPSDIYR